MNRRNPSSSGRPDEERYHQRLPDPCNHNIPPPLHMQQQLPSTNSRAGAETGQIMASAAVMPSSVGGTINPPGDVVASAASSSDKYDPWALYGGNIAAACKATNDTITAQPEKVGATSIEDADSDKQKQRASSRLTAWQSRERKRIEFEVLTERKQELGDRNKILKKENEQLKAFTQRLKALLSSGNATSSTDFHLALGTASSLLSTTHSNHQGDSRTATASTASAASSHQPLPQAQPRALRAAPTFNASSLVGANLARIHQEAVAAAASLQHQQQRQQQNPLLSASFHHQRLAASHRLPHSFLQQQASAGGHSSSSASSSTAGGGTNIPRRGGLADPPQRPPNLLLSSPVTQTTRLPIQRLLGGNDIIAPTIFAPLQRGGDHHHNGQQQQTSHQALAAQYQQLLQQQAQGMLPRVGLSSSSASTSTGLAGSGGNPGCLPLSLSSLIAPPTTTTGGGIDIPLLRAVQQQKRKQAPPQHGIVNKDSSTSNKKKKKAKTNSVKVSSPHSSPSSAGSDGPTI